MNGGPYRASQPDRRVINRSESAPYRQADEPQPVIRDEPQPRATRAPSTARVKAEKSSKKSAIWTVILVVLALIVGGAGGYVSSNMVGGATLPIDPDKYQAVYLMNGQLYFGKLSRADDTHLKLTNVYYLQAKTAEDEESQQNGGSTANNFQLIRLSNAIYGPNDEMIISEDQVLYYQNLTDNSRAAQLIENDR